ncbi:hypothetical protein [Saccharolobus caldissimus]|nr:hypothetical protein [Saccharolobus caldissimus]
MKVIYGEKENISWTIFNRPERLNVLDKNLGIYFNLIQRKLMRTRN